MPVSMTWFFVPRILSAVFVVAILVVITRVLGPADFARYNLTMLLGTILFSFTFLWLVIAISRFHHAKEFEGTTIAMTLGAGAILSVMVLVVSVIASLILPGAWVDGLFYAAIFSVSLAMHEVGTTCLRLYHEGPKFAAVTLLRHALGVAFAIGLVLSGGGYKSAVIGMSLGAALTGAYALGIALKKSGIAWPQLSAIKTYLWFGFPLAVVASSSTFFAMSSQSLLAALAGLEVAGYFAAAQALATRTLGLLMSTIMRVVAPSVFEMQEKHGTASSNAYLERYFSFLMLVSIPLAAALICAPEVLASLLFEADFVENSSEYLRILTLGSFIFGLQGAYISFSFTRAKRTGLQLTITCCALIAHVILSYLIIELLGARGAALAFALSALLSFMAYQYFGRKIDPVTVPAPEIYKAIAGIVAFVPLGLVANSSSGLPVQLGLLTLAAVAMFATLVAVKQTAALVVVAKIRRGLNIGEFPSLK
ncbi:hypothetical protein NBRC116589_28660 [Ruegeria sp. HU-ET01832]